MNTEWSEATKRTVAIGVVLIGIVVLYISRPVLPYIVLAVILAFLLDPVVKFFALHLRMPRWAAVVIAYLFLLLVIALVPLIVLPSTVNAVQDIDIDVMILLESSTAWANQTLESLRHVQFLQQQLDLSPMVDPALDALAGVMPQGMVPSLDQVVSSIPSALELATGFASTIVGTLVSAILAFVLTLVYSIYISLDAPGISESISDFVPAPYRPEYQRLAKEVSLVWMAYFRGQLVLSLIVGTVVGLGALILGLPGALILGILAGLLEVLPTLGPVLAAVPAVLLALMQGSSVLPVSNLVFALIIVGFYIIVQQLENHIIVPRIIGNAIEVHPILVMAAVIVGASVAGIIGAFLAAPIVATGRVLGQYVYNKLLSLPPFPEEEDECEPAPPADESPDRTARSGIVLAIDGLLRKQKQCPDQQYPETESPE